MSTADDWHPVGLSHSVEAGSSAGTRLFDKELVIWRDTAGVAHVWEDRCPHRGMKLSFGFVRGDHIACLYHGWQYDRAGHCQYIPAHPDLDVPNTIKVPRYPAQEYGGMIWTSLSPQAPPELRPAEATVPLRSLYLDCDMENAIAALGAVRLLPFTAQGLADTVVSRVAATLYSISAAGDRLWIGVQAVSDKRTALHLAICGSSKLYQGRGQHHFLDWAMQVCHAAEHPRKPAAPRVAAGAA